jgi:hypothetical protein
MDSIRIILFFGSVDIIIYFFGFYEIWIIYLKFL